MRNFFPLFLRRRKLKKNVIISFLFQIDKEDYQTQENEVERILLIDSVNDSHNATVTRSDVFNQRRAEKTKKNDATLCNDVLLSVRDHFKRPKIEEDRYDIIGRGFAVRLRNLEKKQ